MLDERDEVDVNPTQELSTCDAALMKPWGARNPCDLLLRPAQPLAARLQRNTNGLRQYFSKGTDLSTHSLQRLLFEPEEPNDATTA